MEKFRLTVRVRDLKVGQIFLFSGGWRIVLDIKNGVLYYKNYSEQFNTSHQGNDTIMAGSQMLVELKENTNDER